MELCEEGADGRLDSDSEFQLAASACQGAATNVLTRNLGHPVQEEPFAHHREECVLLVDHRSDAGDEAELALPLEPAARSRTSSRFAVSDLAELADDLTPRLPVHRQYRGQVFEWGVARS